MPRVSGTPGNQKVREHLIKTLRHDFKDVQEHVAEYDHLNYTNVVARWNPRSRKFLTLAAHYDSKLEPEGFIGATDSAAPCAMLLQIAKMVSRYLVKDLQLSL